MIVEFRTVRFQIRPHLLDDETVIFESPDLTDCYDVSECNSNGWICVLCVQGGQDHRPEGDLVLRPAVSGQQRLPVLAEV